MTENNWGTPVQKLEKSKASNSNTWGASVNSYGSGFATVLKVFVAINSLVLPLIVWGAIAAVFADQTDGASVVIAIIGYPITAFVLWVTSSYLVKLFDNISKMAQNTEAILLTLQQNERKEDDFRC